MFKQAWAVGAGIAALAIARFARAVIRAEATRRARRDITDEIARWEAEGGNAKPPASGAQSPHAEASSRH